MTHPWVKQTRKDGHPAEKSRSLGFARDDKTERPRKAGPHTARKERERVRGDRRRRFIARERREAMVRGGLRYAWNDNVGKGENESGGILRYAQNDNVGEGRAEARLGRRTLP